MSSHTNSIVHLWICPFLQFHEALEADSLMTEEYASSKNIDLDDEDVDLEEGDGCEADLWMTSTQFSQLLDKQEAAETQQQPPPTIAPSANSQQKISLAAATEKNNNRASSRYAHQQTFSVKTPKNLLYLDTSTCLTVDTNKLDTVSFC